MGKLTFADFYVIYHTSYKATKQYEMTRNALLQTRPSPTYHLSHAWYASKAHKQLQQGYHKSYSPYSYQKSTP